MSDDKLCPMTFNVAPTEERVGSGTFNCLKERCAWWAEEVWEADKSDHDSIERYTIKDIVHSIKQRLLAADNLADVVKNEGSSTQDFEAALDRWDRS